MNQELRWLHLSDFHVGKDNYGQQKLFSHILQHVADKVQTGFTPDFVFITGDIANQGLETEYSCFASEFLAPLQSVLGTDIKNKIFMVPGNHDVDRRKNRCFDKKGILNNRSRFFDSDENGREDREIVFPRFHAYNTFESAHYSSWLSALKGSYCHNVVTRELPCSIIGINTAWLSDGNDMRLTSPGIDLIEEALKDADPYGIKFVLGHHPIDWFYDDHAEQIRLILAEYNAIYLHGHLHRNRVRIEDGYNFGFLSIQAGAAFQARDDDEWVNGLIWGELDAGSCSIRLQPRRWNQRNRDWPLSNDLPEYRKEQNSDWWKFELPGFQPKHPSPSGLPTYAQFTPPAGLQFVNLEFLKRHYSQADPSNVLDFFNGRQPDWSLAMDPNIPKLSPVSRISENFIKHPKIVKPNILHVTGPTGEGKTTAVMQAILEILTFEAKWEILWSQAFKDIVAIDGILDLPHDNKFWLVVIDAADMYSGKIFNVCQELSNRHRKDISFIICSRDIDWRASKAHEFPWHSISDFKRLTVSGLTSNDADTLVRYWTSFGQNALGKLADYDHHMAVAKLLEAAQKESLIADGALLGALLKVRFGDGLDDYIRSLLLRLASQKATGACSLLHAFAYIAVIQNLELECLSRQVLAEVLYCSSSEVNSRVLPQLGMESAISSDGLFIMTRHREIAGRAVALLQDFDVDCDQLVLHLVNAVRSIMIKGEFLPEINKWHYALPDKLKSIGKADLAIEIIHIFHKTQPANPYLLVKLSSLYREFGDPQSATNLFRNSDHLQNPKNLRAMLLEWGQAEAKARNPALGISLMLLSVADFVRVTPPSYTDLKIFFEITPVYLEILYSQFPRSEVSEAIIAASALGLEIGLPKESNRLMIKRLKRFGQRTTQDIKVEDEVMRLKDALICTHELVDIVNRSIIEDLCSIDMTGYAKLVDSIYDAIDAVENI
jgi:3',5'-cyclic AMP phosphodiesterase CpdA